MNLKKLFAELKRRNVYRAAVAYGVVAWFLTQLTTQVFPFFDIPNAWIRFVVVLLALGFPIAMCLSWLYEFTPEGIVRSEDVDPVEVRSVRRATGRILDFIIIGVLLLVIGMLIYHPFSSRSEAGETTPLKSIAVLPFENRSEDKANAYFADGIQDEILTRLSKVTDLKVISRTSTQQYKSAPENLREIGKQLGVAHLLGGSVQKVGNSVRINVQLIRAATHQHLWAESYNRKLDDIFAVESEVAGAIADKLNLSLSGAEKQDLAARPTNNPEAHDAYLRGVALSERSYLLEADAARAMEAFEKAVTLDPNFALAWARLSRMHSVIFQNSDASAARRDSARNSLQRALQLQPSLLEAQLADAYYNYRVIVDYDRAREILKQVHSKWPNNAEAPHALALVARRQGRWDESLAYFHEALELDPRNLQNLTNATITAQLMRQYQVGLKLIDRALDIAPGDNSSLALKASIFQALGQLDQADAVLGRMQTDASNETAVGIIAEQRLLRHDYRSGVAFMQSALANLDPARRLEHAVYRLLLANLQHFEGDAAGAKSDYTQCRDELESLLREQPDNPRIMSWLAFAHAGLGDKESAVKLQEAALQKLQSANNLYERPIYEEGLARLQARFGDKDPALAIIQRLLSTNGAGITPVLLRLDPAWNSLRDDPRFQALTVEKDSKTTPARP
ncbi:MAG TPA: tetratricopeptide repeat protein [Chthoniobacterales bacterium]|nr:tetratricopeptide repeat protein [Chthoniobacterales bacterium]